MHKIPKFREGTPDIILSRYLSYSQTFDHKSSLGFALKAGLLGCVCVAAFGARKLGELKVVAAGVSGAAVFHPPKSSSAVIFGGEIDWLLKPPATGGDCMLKPPLPILPRSALAVGELPQPKSPVVAEDTEGDLTERACGVGAAGSLVAHASLDAHGSAVEIPENVLLVGGADDCTTG